MATQFTLRPARFTRLVLLLGVAGTAGTLAGLPRAWAETPDWSSAQRKADDFKRKADDLVKEAPVETRKVVAAICAADDESRKSAADSATSSARSAINDKLRDVERLKREALDALDAVDHDDKLKDKHHDAESRASEIKQQWEKLSDMTRSTVNGRHPVVDFMLQHGESARRDHLSRCDAKDVSLNSGHAECLIARGDTCQAVAITSDNSRAISKGKDRAERTTSSLNDELKKPDSSDLKHLISNHHDFGSCKRFEVRVDCYKLCPEIGDDNRQREPSPSWRERCS